MTTIGSRARLLAVTLLLAVGLAILALGIITLRAMLGGPNITGALHNGPVYSDLLSLRPLSSLHIFGHNLVSLVVFAAAPGVAALRTAGVRTAVPAQSLDRTLALVGLRRRLRPAGASTNAAEGNFRGCVFAGALLAGYMSLYFGESLRSIAAGWQVNPALLMVPLVEHHGVLEWTALLLPFAALLVCWPRRWRAALPWLLGFALAVAVLLLAVAAHIEASATPAAMWHVMWSSPVTVAQ